MLVQDSVSGTIEEVPDLALYENDPTVYNGLGDPVGLFPGLPNPFDLIKRAVGGISNIISPQPPPGLPMPPPTPFAPPPFAPTPFAPGFPPGMSSMFPQMRPPGWMTPPSPYMGPHPRRLYLRCSTWRGPQGLVPTNPAPWPTPPVPPPAETNQPVYRRRGGGGGRRFRRLR